MQAFHQRTGEGAINLMTKRERVLEMLPAKLEEHFRNKLLDVPSMTYPVLRQMIMDRIHEASAVAPPMGVDNFERDGGGGDGPAYAAPCCGAGP